MAFLILYSGNNFSSRCRNSTPLYVTFNINFFSSSGQIIRNGWIAGIKRAVQGFLLERILQVPRFVMVQRAGRSGGKHVVTTMIEAVNSPLSIAQSTFSCEFVYDYSIRAQFIDVVRSTAGVEGRWRTRNGTAGERWEKVNKVVVKSD